MRIIQIFYFIFFILACSSNMAQTRTKSLPLNRIAIANGTILIAPGNYKPEKAKSKFFHKNDFELNLYARQFVHGDLIYFELIPLKTVSSPEVIIDKKVVFLTKHEWGYRGFFAIHPEAENKQVNIKVNYQKDHITNSEQINLQLEKKVFPVARSSMDLGKYSRTDITSQKDIQERIQFELKEKAYVYSEVDPDHISNTLAYPRDFHKLNSSFYIKRIYEQFEMKNGKKIKHKPRISYHRGQDFLANVGDPIYAMAAGKIALAKELYFEGNCIFIDHGNKILTVYMHMSKLNTHKGQFVKAGHLIGFAGSTGISTGAHLHVSMFVDGIPVDPLSFIYLPIRN